MGLPTGGLFGFFEGKSSVGCLQKTLMGPKPQLATITPHGGPPWANPHGANVGSVGYPCPHCPIVNPVDRFAGFDPTTVNRP